jgi:hypothetical protein
MEVILFGLEFVMALFPFRFWLGFVTEIVGKAVYCLILFFYYERF